MCYISTTHIACDELLNGLEYTCRGVHALLTYPDFVVKHEASNNYPSRVLANCCHHKLKLKALVSLGISHLKLSKKRRSS